MTSMFPERSAVTAAVGSESLTNLISVSFEANPKYFGFLTIVSETFGLNSLTMNGPDELGFTLNVATSLTLIILIPASATGRRALGVERSKITLLPEAVTFVTILTLLRS
ncbi:unannotated protein [freshwater metagenome]|uniref:Unannotated protein n=1 Tax=freshwater metagenome TaxID=449393 RepID=A0A6J6FZD2_9ZZZZ